MEKIGQKNSPKSNRKMTPALFKALYKEYRSRKRTQTMTEVCDAHGVTKSLFYVYLKREIEAHNKKVALKSRVTKSATSGSPGQENTTELSYHNESEKTNQDNENGINIR